MKDARPEPVRRRAATGQQDEAVPPNEGESRVESAMRRYLGASLFTYTRNRSKTQDDAQSPSSNGPTQPDDRES